MVFEYIDKGDLVKYFKENALLDEEPLQDFFLKILRAIEYLHKQNIIHRDIKLDNILIDRNMNPKICDFGISSEKETGKKIYDTGGTPAFLAPEVILGQGEVDFKTDVWSLGVLLYLLTFGTVPFEADNV